MPRKRFLQLSKKSNSVLQLSWYKISGAKTAAAAAAAAAAREDNPVNVGCQVPVGAILMGSMKLDKSSLVFDEGYNNDGKIRIRGAF